MKIAKNALRNCLILLPILVSSASCAAVAVTALGVGAATGVSYTLNGIAYKTFTKPMKTVKKASVKALGNMGITVDSKDVNKAGEEVLNASSGNRRIEIILEPISANATRMRVKVAQKSFLMDRATAIEIIMQTERMVEVIERRV